MGRSLIKSSLLILMIIAVFPLSGAAADTIFWYLPHPDDETLGMADSIYQSVLAGSSNHFIYFTKGSNSLARYNLRGPDGNIYHLSREEFGAARVAETLAALAALSVNQDQVVFLDYPDGGIPQTAAEAIMRYFALRYPGSIHRTVHILDSHPDHKTLAKALAKVAQEDGIEISTEFYHVYIHRSQIPKEGVGRKAVLYPEVRELAIAEFGKWDPENNRYGIGMVSTADLFNAVRTSPYEYVDSDISHLLPTGTNFTSHLVLSNLAASYVLGIGDKISINSSLDFRTSALELGLGYRFNSNLPLTAITIEGGYHCGHQVPYGTVRAEIMDYFIISLKHILNNSTKIGFGISIQLF